MKRFLKETKLKKIPLRTQNSVLGSLGCSYHQFRRHCKVDAAIFCIARHVREDIVAHAIDLGTHYRVQAPYYRVRLNP